MQSRATVRRLLVEAIHELDAADALERQLAGSGATLAPISKTPSLPPPPPLPLSPNPSVDEDADAVRPAMFVHPLKSQFDKFDVARMQGLEVRRAPFVCMYVHVRARALLRCTCLV